MTNFWIGSCGVKVILQLYLADNVGRQFEQAEGVSFVPRVQHAEEMGDVISTIPCEGKNLPEQR